MKRLVLLLTALSLIFMFGCKDEEEAAPPAAFSISNMDGLWLFEYSEATLSCTDETTISLSASSMNVMIAAPVTSDDVDRYRRQGGGYSAGDVVIDLSSANFILSGDISGIGIVSDSGNSIFRSTEPLNNGAVSYSRNGAVSYVMDFESSPTSGSVIHNIPDCAGPGQVTATKQ